MTGQVLPNINPISGQVLFYSQPEPLDAQRHGRLGMNTTDRPFSFAAKQHFIPLHAGEFGPAAISYPIIFAGQDYAPLAVMGLTTGENLFISEDGLYRSGVYVPSFIRRYPFVGARDDDAKRTIVCIDRASDLWVEGKADVMLFENGQPTEFTKSCIEFCSQFDNDRAQSDFFIKLLRDLDLFETRQATFTPRLENNVLGEPQMVAEFFAVSEQKLKDLPAAKFAELRDNGALPLIYAHMTSLFGWERLIAESLARRAAAQTADA
ncbi:MAG TPA: SapC family protein [Caulobacteraceae bacterium]|nr:SapC family protein [Caulobacteraceae bacterium]